MRDPISIHNSFWSTITINFPNYLSFVQEVVSFNFFLLPRTLKNSKTWSTGEKTPLECSWDVGPLNGNVSLTLNINLWTVLSTSNSPLWKTLTLSLFDATFPLESYSFLSGHCQAAFLKGQVFVLILCYCIDWENIKVEESLELLKHEPSFHRWRNQDEDKVTGQRPPSLNSDHSAPNSWSH